MRGKGASGQLGLGDTDTRLALTRVAGLPAPVRQVAAGLCHTDITRADYEPAVTEDGALWARGHCRAYEVKVQSELEMNGGTPPAFFSLFQLRDDWAPPPRRCCPT